MGSDSWVNTRTSTIGGLHHVFQSLYDARQDKCKKRKYNSALSTSFRFCVSLGNFLFHKLFFSSAKKQRTCGKCELSGCCFHGKCHLFPLSVNNKILQYTDSYKHKLSRETHRPQTTFLLWRSSVLQPF